MRFNIFFLFLLIAFAGCTKSSNPSHIDLQKQIDDCENQLKIAVPKLTDLTKHPRLIDKDKKEWNIKKISEKASLFQTGFIYDYAFAMLIGLSILLTYLILN